MLRKKENRVSRSTNQPIPITSDVLDPLLQLNNDHFELLSWLTKDEFAQLIKDAFYAREMGNGQGMLVAFDQDALYESPNFLWFKTRYSRFIYIDRIVISDRARGNGFGRTLYEDLFCLAQKSGYEQVCCEVNIHPPNPGSHIFHKRLGFEQVGEAEIPHYDRDGETKRVTYYMLDLGRYPIGT